MDRVWKRFPSVEDLLEMKSRGYDRTTLEEAEQRHARSLRVDALKEQITKAFAGVQLGQGVGLQETLALDDYADAATCAAIREKDEKEDWSRIPRHNLPSAYGGPCFFDAEGMRFHLPCYLLEDLEREEGNDIIYRLVDMDGYNREQMTLLSREQRAAVADFLELLAEEDDFGRLEMKAAIESFWRVSEA